MSIAELVPTWPGLPEPTGSPINRQSIRNRKYRMRSNHIGFSLDDILLSRGVIDVDTFIKPTLSTLPNPSNLMDMDEASVRFATAIINKEKILVFGDYDVDGACSTSLIVKFAKELGLDVDFYIPDRITEGYGPSKEAFDNSSINDYDLVIFVDCGTTSSALIDNLNPDVIIIDHHQALDILPICVACVNPHRIDDKSGMGMLCAAGLCFMFIMAVRRTLRSEGYFNNRDIPDLRNYLDIAALATVADVVPLVGVSRTLVYNGLKVMDTNPSEAIKALMSAAGVKEASAGRIGFALGPRINAAGRVGSGSTESDGALGTKLLISDDTEYCREISSKLNAMNKERQDVEKKALEDAMELASEQVASGVKIICLWNSDWHPGIVGIVAGRIKEKYDMPTIIGSESDNIIKASGRSISGFDLGALIAECRKRGLLIGGGGHAMACGLSIDASNWEEFVQYLNDNAHWTANPSIIDTSINVDDLDIDKVNDLDKIQPTGQGNPSVVSLINNFKVAKTSIFSNNHVKLSAYNSNAEVIFWNAAEDETLKDIFKCEGKTISIIGSVSINRWNDRERIQIIGSDIIF